VHFIASKLRISLHAAPLPDMVKSLRLECDMYIIKNYVTTTSWPVNRRRCYELPKTLFILGIKLQVHRFLVQISTDTVALTGLRFFTVSRKLLLTVSVKTQYLLKRNVLLLLKLYCSVSLALVWLLG
jgi:hypothetical protein